MIVPCLGAAGIAFWKLATPDRVEFSLPRMNVMNSKPGGAVERVEDLACEVSKGWPVVLVRDATDDSHWWVQGPVKQHDAIKYSARVHFGNETTTPGQKFQIVVLSVANEPAAQQFEAGTVLERIPEDLPRSESIEVVRR